ncbi:scarecrow-like protein 21 [Apium graveolens]|uniref:scarecrow-like protein 21 n=1 Tax=Apium graveolens TaxID=4045 RepID=UPI003D79D8A8
MTGFYSVQSSQDPQYFYQSERFYNQPQPAHEFESQLWNHCQHLDDKLWFDDGSQEMQVSGKASQSYGTPEAAMATGGYPGTSFAVSRSANGSPISGESSLTYPSGVNHSPGNNIYSSHVSDSSYLSDLDILQHKIREIETAMLGPEPDIAISGDNSVFGGPGKMSSEKDYIEQMMAIIASGDIKEVLVNCAKAVAYNDLLHAEWLISELRPKVSVSGNPVQRLGAYMLEGLVARLSSSGNSICKTLKCKEPTSSELLSYMHLLYEVCPYFKFGYMSANGAIADAMKDEKSIHIIDFQISEGAQWFTLIQALAARPGGPPRIRITGIDDVTSAYAREGGLDIVGNRLSSLAESCRVPFEFNAATLSGSDVDTIKIIPGEALAVNFAFILHHIPDESVGTVNHRDKLLRFVKSLSPKVVTIIEQEANTNTLFMPRFLETMNYYMAVFESIDVTLPRDHKERINVEQHCLARDIVNIVACEGAERVERQELLEKWKSRFAAAGFQPYPLSPYVNATIKSLLKNYSEHYTLKERDGALYLGWLKQDLVASCAWS